jgi:hypothetical protein
MNDNNEPKTPLRETLERESGGNGSLRHVNVGIAQNRPAKHAVLAQ